MTTKANIELPPKLVDVFSGEARYRLAYGGRGSGKTRSFALMTAVRGYILAEAGETGTILCAREYMNSLDDSSMQEVKDSIASLPWLADYYDVGERYIRTKNRRIYYTFTGLRHNLDSVKGKTAVRIVWADEAEGIGENAWRKLIPTVRAAGSEIWVTWNPELDGSATDKRFIKAKPARSKIAELNYSDNPWFPSELEEERAADQQRLDPATYAHVWEGEYLKNSNAQVLAGKVEVKDFVPDADWGGPYFGIDWGFSQDPTVGVKCWVHDGSLYVEHEAGKVGLELDDTAEYLSEYLPSLALHTSRADNARPETISHVKRNGLPKCEAVDKWPGSVEDGISHLRNYHKIIIHPRCHETIRETRLYSYKVDRLSGDILPTVIDAFNHYIDAIRYAISPMIRGVSTYTLDNL